MARPLRLNFAGGVYHVTARVNKRKAFSRTTRWPSEARPVAVYGLRRWAGLGLTAIGHQMGLSYTAVSRRVNAVARPLATNHRVREQIARLSHGQLNLTPFA